MAEAKDNPDSATSAMSGERQPTPPAADADDDLVERALRDRAAFGELYRRYLPRVYRYALARTGDAEQAQDITAQTFLAALEGLGSYRRTGTFLAWLLTIARHKVVDHARRQRAVEPLEQAAELASREPSPDQIVAARLELEQVLRVLRGLAPDRAEAFALRMFGELTAAEVAVVLGKSEAAVKMLVHRAVRDLRERLAFRIEAEL
jgi:RNA polymerase sigma-70 factor (ECF subfamily)